MGNLKNLEKYYSLYDKIQEIPRFAIKQVSPALSIGGRGQKYDTVRKYVNQLYTKKISLRPNLVLRTFENCFWRAYFLKVRSTKNISSAFVSLTQNPKLSYVLFLSGEYDFFVTSKQDLSQKYFGKDIKVKKKCISYTPIYTIPRGWNCTTKDALLKIAEMTLSKGKLERKMEDWLPWDEIHFKIYEILKNNFQLPLSRVVEKTSLTYNTIKKYLNEMILPYCNISHYFFPKGYDHYQQSFIITHSEYEKELVDAFSRMPCTTYVYPLEEEIVFNLFHESINDLMYAIRKLEEKGYIEKYLLQVPLYWE